MRNSRAVFLTLICLLCAGLIAACGDDNESGDATSEEFIADADKLCTDTAQEELRNPEPTPTTPEEAAAALEKSVKERQEVIADFEALGEPPSEIADEWEQLTQLRQQRLANARELLTLARQGVASNEQRYADVVAESSELSDQSDEIYAEIGSTACAGILPAAERKKVIEFVTFWETQPLDDCTKYTTQDGIELAFGSVEECQKAQENPPPEGFTKRVKVTSVDGIAEVNAQVDASLFGGIGDGQKVTYNLVFEDGRYKVDSVTLQAGLTS